MRFLLLICCLLSLTGKAQKIDKALQGKLEKEIRGFQGDIGIYVQNLKTGKWAGIAADTVFPTASIVKVPILVGVFEEVGAGNLKLDQAFIYNAKRVYSGSGLMQY